GAGTCPPDARWVAGSRPWPVGMDRETAPASLQWLAGSGYVVMRDHARDDWAMFDVGDIAHGVPTDDLASAAHGHADLLGFELLAAGAPRLIDPGFVTYNGPVAWHRHFRDTHAHNALVVDDRSQATYRGRLTWSHGATARLTHAVGGEVFTYVEGAHDAYVRGDLRVSHARALLWVRPGVWIVIDRLTGTGTHVLDRFFHFAPGQATARPHGARGAEVNGVALRVDCLEADVDCRLSTGAPEPDGGWVATHYEEKVPAAVLRARVRRDVPTTLVTLLAADAGDGPHWDVTSPTPRLVWPDGRALVLRGEDSDGQALESDAHCAAVLLAADGRPTAAIGIGATRLAWCGRTLYTATSPTDVLLHEAGGTLVPGPAQVLR
ncbi:MAG TPA: heparinase II/III-family protein, partial [Luteitalea sp.]|nr:heparinase II/III-family protein [Luteitalea sp.]